MKVVIFLALLAFLGLLCSCGFQSERTEQLVEREDLIAGPMTVETPIGNFVVHPTQVRRFRTQDTRENSKSEMNFPEARALGGAMLGGLTGPLAGGGVVGLLAAFFLRRQSIRSSQERSELDQERQRAERQRDEIIRGVERSKSKLDPAQWEVLTENLERSQSQDTIKVVKDKTS